MSLATTHSGLRNALYVSTRANGASVADWNTEIQEILARARVFNTWHGVTGALLTNDKYFVQVLEGTVEGLSAIVPPIMADRRHHIVRVQGSNIPERSFKQWSMAYVPATGMSVEVLGAMVDFLHGAPARGTLAMMRHLLEGAADEEA